LGPHVDPGESMSEERAGTRDEEGIDEERVDGSEASSGR